MASSKELVAYFKQDSMLAAVKECCLSTVKPEMLIKILCQNIMTNPKLCECSQESIYSSLIDCATSGLEPRFGLAWFVPFKGKCTFIIGYQGYRELARRCGVHASVEAVYSCDKFEWTCGTNPNIVHVPDIRGDRTEQNFIAAYCIYRIDGELQYTVMTKSEIDSIRRRAKSQDIWTSDYVEMAKKTVIRRAAKNWPRIPEVFKAIEEDDIRSFGQYSVQQQTNIQRQTDRVLQALNNSKVINVQQIEQEEAEEPVELNETYSQTIERKIRNAKHKEDFATIRDLILSGTSSKKLTEEEYNALFQMADEKMKEIENGD